MPRTATKPTGLLDRLGAVHVSPDQVGFDGTEINWDRVTEIRMQPAWTSLTASTLEAEFKKYASALPPDEDGTIQLPGQAIDDDLINHTVVTEIGYRRRAFGAGGEVEARTAATVLQLLIPEATAAIVSTAQVRQIPIRNVQPGTGDFDKEARRGAQWRKTALRLQERVARRERVDTEVRPETQ